MAKYLGKKNTNNMKNSHLTLGLFLCILFTFSYSIPSAAQITPRVQLVSISSSGTTGNRAASQASISGDGRFVAFISEANNLSPNDSNGSADVFVHDRLYGTTELVSISSSGMQANAEVTFARISLDGRFVIFESPASNLTPNYENGFNAIFQHDRLTGITERLSTSIQGIVNTPSTSSDGRYSAFSNNTEIYIHDSLTRFSYAINSAEVHDPASKYDALLSSDGR
ncbi:MAG: hypothetical protein ABFS03_08615, partial [Chloroflexota bacterium]